MFNSIKQWISTFCVWAGTFLVLGGILLPAIQLAIPHIVTDDIWLHTMWALGLGTVYLCLGSLVKLSQTNNK